MFVLYVFFVNLGEVFVNVLVRVVILYVVSNECDVIIGECSSGLVGWLSNDRGFCFFIICVE